MSLVFKGAVGGNGWPPQERTDRGSREVKTEAGRAAGPPAGGEPGLPQ